MISNQSRGLNKGPGPIRDGLNEVQHRVYFAVQHCKWAVQAKDCLRIAQGENSPLAQRLRELAREAGRRARDYYAEAVRVESGVGA